MDIRKSSWWYWSMCSTCRHHFKFDCQHTWEGSHDHLKGEAIFTLTSYNFSMSTPIHKTWNDNSRDSQLLTHGDTFPSWLDCQKCLWKLKVLKIDICSNHSSLLNTYIWAICGKACCQQQTPKKPCYNETESYAQIVLTILNLIVNTIGKSTSCTHRSEENRDLPFNLLQLLHLNFNSYDNLKIHNC